VRAPHDARVDGRHDEGPGPAAHVRVPANAALVGAVGRVRAAPPAALRIERVRIGDQPPHAPVVGRLLHQVHHARRGAAAHRALEGHDVPDLVARCPARRARVRLDHERAQVRGDGVEAAAVHDARAGLARPRVVPVDHVADERDLPGEVAVVGRRLHARGDELAAVDGVGADGGGHDARLAYERVERGAVAAVGRQDGEVARGRVDALEAAADLFELGAVAPGDPPAHALADPLAPGEVLGDQPARVAGGSPDDDVERSRFAHGAGA